MIILWILLNYLKMVEAKRLDFPKEFQFEGSDVYVKKFEDIVLLIPKDSKWTTLETSLDYFSDDFLKERNQPKIQDRDDF